MSKTVTKALTVIAPNSLEAAEEYFIQYWKQKGWIGVNFIESHWQEHLWDKPDALVTGEVTK